MSETTKDVNVKTLPKDQYNRDAAERTIELPSHIAQAISDMVDDKLDEEVFKSIKAENEGGEPNTFDESLGYIIYRGLAEIKRAWDAKELRKREKQQAKKQDLYKSMLAVNPALIADKTFVDKMLQDLFQVKQQQAQAPQPKAETKAA